MMSVFNSIHLHMNIYKREKNIYLYNNLKSQRKNPQSKRHEWQPNYRRLKYS